MSSGADDRIGRRLDDLVTFATEAEYVVGRGRDAYLADTPEGAMLRNAGERVLIKVATVVEKLPDEYKQAHSDVEWVAISRMRNLVAHHEDKVNDDVMWVALAARVPRMLVTLDLTASPPPSQCIVNEAAVRRAAADCVKASAKLEGRVVTPGYQRSAAAAKYIASRADHAPR